MTADVVIVGAGIVGLAHAVEAVRRGLSTVVVDRDDFASGASVRNFGHGCVTGQAGPALEYGLIARERWLDLGAKAGFDVSTAGTVVAARADDELAVLAEFQERSAQPVELLDRQTVLERVPLNPRTVLGGAWLPLDVRVDPRTAIPAIASWLAEQGVDFRWATNVLGVETGTVHTSRGRVDGSAVVVATGHDTDRLFPGLTEPIALRRCVLHMLRVEAPGGVRFDPAVLTGLSLLRYDGFAACPSAASIRARFAAERPDLLDAQVNLMFTQRPTGELTIGDTHSYGRTPEPFRPEEYDELLLHETAALLGVPSLRVRERWAGVYASSPMQNFLIEAPAPGVRVVAVTTGIGMTTALGLAPSVLAGLY
ncbi:TIGR03364 family FAD-dependent oxidoreductase [Cryptosporangium phraense]|uniref:TIGR03364 family FAD-dependent oxidoreductase n=1 Tax=Cryptosporangium phraense TaxID=2593070 RepID=A0A545AL73_9ACTN|nr:TIGR03364 family FAD-dependent oxidoreductase [Cryptosporangium phraense]TQS42063.1 TIGR03364 family FAD-dependent oxidoreductase [Cryptosporangium phraense]